VDKIIEPSREINVIDEVDICVIGGSCTGVFAAVRAARLGAKVAIIEKQNSFGGVAASGLVNYWHSLYDTEFQRQIIAGLTLEVIDRLKLRNSIIETPNSIDAYKLNTEELKIELDELVLESKIKTYLHTYFVAAYCSDNDIESVIVENKSGRSAIKAKFFIDATGDGDLCARVGNPFTINEKRQPPTTCAKFYGFRNLVDFDMDKAIMEHKDEFKLKEGFGWTSDIPNAYDVTLHAPTRIYDSNCVDANSLTISEIEGRRQIRAIMDIVRKYGPIDQKISLVSLPSHIGVRETRHVKCQYQLSEDDVLSGGKFEDAIANGSYRVEVHQSDRPGTLFKYLDGKQVFQRRGYPNEESRWRKETVVNPKFYQIPFRVMVPNKIKNLLVCGRAIDADQGAFGAIRVMVNLNQTGEAAGVAAYVAISSKTAAKDIDVKKVRDLLKKGGSIVL